MSTVSDYPVISLMLLHRVQTDILFHNVYPITYNEPPAVKLSPQTSALTLLYTLLRDSQVTERPRPISTAKSSCPGALRSDSAWVPSACVCSSCPCGQLPVASRTSNDAYDSTHTVWKVHVLHLPVHKPYQPRSLHSSGASYFQLSLIAGLGFSRHASHSERCMA